MAPQVVHEALQEIGKWQWSGWCWTWLTWLHSMSVLPLDPNGACLLQPSHQSINKRVAGSTVLFRWTTGREPPCFFLCVCVCLKSYIVMRCSLLLQKYMIFVQNFWLLSDTYMANTTGSNSFSNWQCTSISIAQLACQPKDLERFGPLCSSQPSHHFFPTQLSAFFLSCQAARSFGSLPQEIGLHIGFLVVGSYTRFKGQVGVNHQDEACQHKILTKAKQVNLDTTTTPKQVKTLQAKLKLYNKSIQKWIWMNFTTIYIFFFYIT